MKIFNSQVCVIWVESFPNANKNYNQRHSKYFTVCPLHSRHQVINYNKTLTYSIIKISFYTCKTALHSHMYPHQCKVIEVQKSQNCWMKLVARYDQLHMVNNNPTNQGVVSTKWVWRAHTCTDTWVSISLTRHGGGQKLSIQNYLSWNCIEESFKLFLLLFVRRLLR